MKTILVVDDSAICREPIAATLRLKGYQTLEAANGQEALQVAQTHNPDLILLDVSMPVMDGLACLDELRTRQATARIPVIMLTATSERRVIVTAAQKGVAGFLLKTKFSTEELIHRVQAQIGEPGSAPNTQPAGPATRHEETPAAVAARIEPRAVEAAPPRAEAAHRLTRAEVLRRLDREIELRSIQPVLEYVIALTRSGTSTLEDVAAAIRQDQALALRVLRVANSSFYQRGRDAKTLVEATQRIGLTAVRNTVIAILAIDHFEQVTVSGLIPQRFWEHSIATGVLAELIGEAASCRQTDHLFLAGLLHDLGRMVLSTLFAKEYAGVLTSAAEQDRDLELAEREFFGLSHSDVTRELLARWNMPPSIVEAASHHHGLVGELRGSGPDARSRLAVALANRLAHALAAGDSGNARLVPYREFASELRLDQEAIHRLASVAVQKMADMEMFYAAQSPQHFREPLPTELAKKATIAPRVAVLGPNANADPVSLFFGQLGWLEPTRPTVVIISGSTQLDALGHLPALQELEASHGGPIPAITVVTSAPSDEWKAWKPATSIKLPCGYMRLVDAVISCSPPNAPARSSPDDCQRRR